MVWALSSGWYASLFAASSDRKALACSIEVMVCGIVVFMV